jgi:hypothetical protein
VRDSLKSSVKFNFAKEVTPGTEARYPYKYSIYSLVTRIAEYEGMIDSFLRGGFTPDCCEYLFINNSIENRADAYQGYNFFLQSARGEYVIICHQDVVLLASGIQQLDERTKELDRLDPSWAVLGNAGVTRLNHAALHITHPEPYGENYTGNLPAKVHSLDENFILVKNSANLFVSHDLSGFHLYGTDICLVAHIAGRTCWVVDFNLLRKSAGKIDASFYELCERLENKHLATGRAGLLHTTCTQLSLSHSWFQQKKTRFTRIYDARKNRLATEVYRAEMFKSFGSWSYLSFWLLRRVSRPFENLTRHIKKYRAPGTH